MSDQNKSGLQKIRRALISVSDKTGIVDFARELKTFGVEIISTGGTAQALRDAGIEVRDVSDVTGFPEMMDGRIKTLHPKIHGALLGLRDKAEHVAAMREHGIGPIDMVVINLYPFGETMRRAEVSEDEVTEQIDIGGPAMVRSAAKNAHYVAVIMNHELYADIIREMQQNEGSLTLATRKELAKEAFGRTAMYDTMIAAYLNGAFARHPRESDPQTGGIGGGGGGADFNVISSWKFSTPPPRGKIDSEGFSVETFRGSLPTGAQWSINKSADLRYGENPTRLPRLQDVAPGGI
jgi:AICAR transformylase/IMP cyclohydrolase PurH